MSTILTNRLRHHLEASVRDHLDLSDCEEDTSKALSRGIAAMAIAGLSGSSYATVAKYVTDGPRDNGIDAVYFDGPKNKLYLVQAKWSSKGTSTIETGELHKFIAGVYALLNEQWKDFNARMRAVAPEVSRALREDPEIVLVVTYNSDNPLSPDCQAILQGFLDENNSDSQDVVSYRNFGLKYLLRTMKTAKAGSKTDVEVNLLQWGEQKEPYYSVYGKVSCADVAEWYKAHEESLFTENIRGALSESGINFAIEAALLQKPADFWYMNNGITAIADEISRKPIGLGEQRDSSNWNVGNLKIVNGAQTTSSIARAYARNPKQVQRAYVQIKIISLENAPIDIATRITTATNTQNRVEPKDFLALDTVQDGLAESFKKLGVQYCYRRGDKVIDPQRGLDVQELAMTLAVGSDSMTDVVIAKRNAGSLTDPNGHYPKIFTKRLVAATAWDAVRRWRAANKAVSDFAATQTGREAQLAVHGSRFLEHLLVRSARKSFDEPLVALLHKSLKSAVDQLYSDCYLAVLFKNAKKCELLREAINAADPLRAPTRRRIAK